MGHTIVIAIDINFYKGVGKIIGVETLRGKCELCNNVARGSGGMSPQPLSQQTLIPIYTMSYCPRHKITVTPYNIANTTSSVE